MLIPFIAMIFAFSLQGQSTEAVRKIAYERAQAAVELFKKSSVSDSCFEFINNEQWSRDGVSLQIFESKGYCLVDNGYHQDIWKNFNRYTDSSYRSLLRTLLSSGTKGAWCSFPWLNSLRHVYACVVPKENREYIISAGYYDETAPTVTETIVHGIIDFWSDHGFEKTKQVVNNPQGIFVSGDIFGVIITKEGFGRAYGGHVAWLGHDDMIDLANKDEQKFAYELAESFDALKNGMWKSYIHDGSEKKVYAQSFIDPVSKEPYIIYAGYYDLPRALIEDRTHQLCDILRDKKLHEVYTELAHDRKKIQLLCPEPLHIRVTLKQGSIVLETITISHEGKLLQYFSDSDQIIDPLARDECEDKGWVLQVQGSALAHIYYEKVQTADGECIVSTEGCFLRSAEEIAHAMAHDAATYLAHHTRVETCIEMIKRSPRFVRGTIATSIFDFLGYCWIDTSFIRASWYRDTEIVQSKDGWILDERTIPKRVYIQSLKKDEGYFKIVGHFVLGSG